MKERVWFIGSLLIVAPSRLSQTLDGPMRILIPSGKTSSEWKTDLEVLEKLSAGHRGPSGSHSTDTCAAEGLLAEVSNSWPRSLIPTPQALYSQYSRTSFRLLVHQINQLTALLSWLISWIPDRATFLNFNSRSWHQPCLSYAFIFNSSTWLQLALFLAL